MLALYTEQNGVGRILLMLPILTISPLPPSSLVHEYGSQDENGIFARIEAGGGAADLIRNGANAWAISMTPKKLTSKIDLAASSEVSSAAP